MTQSALPVFKHMLCIYQGILPWVAKARQSGFTVYCPYLCAILGNSPKFHFSLYIHTTWWPCDIWCPLRACMFSTLLVQGRVVFTRSTPELWITFPVCLFKLQSTLSSKLQLNELTAAILDSSGKGQRCS